MTGLDDGFDGIGRSSVPASYWTVAVSMRITCLTWKPSHLDALSASCTT